MSVGAFVYQKITRRFSTLFLAASFGAFFMNYAFNEATDAYWDWYGTRTLRRSCGMKRRVKEDGLEHLMLQ
ncbi:unnamed protein product [Angiostrongylus costaricensis]|uniref:Complex III subunit 9 n=1 Tax=Angiostrongylus costaricensis TaxID=334426 RepID=A0A0R3PZM4_ANGCS|nr:unnamed protein product [Angiostrongylus costaricensis]